MASTAAVTTSATPAEAVTRRLKPARHAMLPPVRDKSQQC
jgi:hypothetical protein